MLKKLLEEFIKIMSNNIGSLMTEGDPAPEEGGDTPPEDGGDPNPEFTEGMKSLYGDLADKIEWPEGMDDDLKLAPSIKQFVDKEGKLRNAEILKSYVNAQKMRNQKGVTPPTEHSTKEEWDEYFAKVGYETDPEKYDIGGKPEDLEMTDEFLDGLKKTLHENRIPVESAKKIKGFLEEQAKTNFQKGQEAVKAEIEEGLEGLKKEFGAAYDDKITKAKNLLREFGEEDKALLEAFEDPRLGNNPTVIKLLAKMAEVKYAEGKIDGKPTSHGNVTPDEARDQIAELQANPAYWDGSHPEYKVLQKKADKLYRMANGER